MSEGEGAGKLMDNVKRVKRFTCGRSLLLVKFYRHTTYTYIYIYTFIGTPIHVPAYMHMHVLVHVHVHVPSAVGSYSAFPSALYVPYGRTEVCNTV